MLILAYTNIWFQQFHQLTNLHQFHFHFLFIVIFNIRSEIFMSQQSWLEEQKKKPDYVYSMITCFIWREYLDFHAPVKSALLLVIEPDCFLFVFDVIFYQIIIHETVNQLFKTEITFVGLKVSDVMFSLFEIWLWH